MYELPSNGGGHAAYATQVYAESAPAPSGLRPISRGHYAGHQGGDWDVSKWDWNSVLFLAQPSSSPLGTTADHRKRSLAGPAAQIGHLHHQASTSNGIGLRLDGASSSPDQNGSSDHDDPYAIRGRRGESLEHPQIGSNDEGNTRRVNKTQAFLRDESSPEEEAETLSLRLGGHGYAFRDENRQGSRDAKRYRSSSPVPVIPACQVDDCSADLSRAKDYHRRHKVCEMHAKAVKALVNRLMQRFCQQCSRFHPLAEFDEGKRSCRRRLAGHNRRRRKNQPDSSPGGGGGVLDEGGLGNASGLLGVLNLLNSLQAVNGIVNERDALLQYIKKGGVIPPNDADNSANTSVADLLNQNGPAPEKRSESRAPSFIPNGATANTDSEAQALLSALATPKTTDALSLLLQSSLKGNLNNTIMKVAESPLVQVGQSSANSALPVATPSSTLSRDARTHANAGPVLSLSSSLAASTQAVNHIPSTSSRGNSFQQQGVARNSGQVEPVQAELLQDRGNPVRIAQQLFPQAQAGQLRNMGKLPVTEEEDAATESTSEADLPASMMTNLEGQDFLGLQDVISQHSRPSIDLQRPASCFERNESSPSGSDQSPSSSYSDWEDRTGQISIKLFDRSPGELPQLLRSQILDWLAHRPSDMESYIRPGCTVLTVFLSMPDAAWETLERDLRISLNRLTASSEFWRNGLIHVQVDKRNAFIHDGRIRVNRPLQSSKAPQLVSLWPAAVVAGQKAKLILRGFNLRQPEVRVFLAYEGKYVHEGLRLEQGLQKTPEGLLTAPQNDTEHEELSISFDVGVPGILGRAFVEVERQMGGGNSLPVIVADGPVCAELQMLEETDSKVADRQQEPVQSIVHSCGISAQLDPKCFVSELGWLFQRSRCLVGAEDFPKFAASRQRKLLAFAVERDWIAVVSKLLDVVWALAQQYADGPSLVVKEVFGHEFSLLHVAVRRRCTPMVELLLTFAPASQLSRESQNSEEVGSQAGQGGSIFPPDLSGPEGVTPLHVAASMERALEIVDALTDDPKQIGLDAWSTSKNAKGETPLICAVQNGNDSYVQLVRQKVGRRDGSLSIDIPHEEEINKQGDKATVATQNLELPCWSNNSSRSQAKSSTGGATPLATQVAYRRSCRHVPPTLRGYGGSMYRPFLLSMMAVAAVCVCACIIFKGPPDVEHSLRPFSWGSLKIGPM